MPLESLGKDEGKLDIRKIETPETEVPFAFDFKKEFTPHVWERIKKDLTGEDNFNRFLDCSSILELFPEKRREFTKESWTGGITALIAEEEAIFTSRISMLRTARLMFPEIPLSSYGINGITQLFLDYALEEALSMQARKQWSSLASYLEDLLVVAPEFRNRLDLEGIYENFITKLKAISTNFSWDKVELAGKLAFLYPDKDVRSMLTESDLHSAYAKFIEALQEDDWHYAGSVARAFAFIEAEKIILGRDGFELTKRPKQDFKTQTPPLPELKK